MATSILNIRKSKENGSCCNNPFPKAVNGKDGVNKAISNVPDLILTDILMPEMNGFEVCRELKSNKLTKNIPIICLTACASDEQRMQCYSSGADGYMAKPFNANVLRVRIATMIEKNKSLSEEMENEIFPGTNIQTLGDKQRQFMNKFKEYVETNIQEAIGIEDLARELGVSKSGLYRQLKEITDYNPVDLISLIKLRKGIRLILLEQQSIAEAAYATGFSSPSYFTKTFVKYYNETPTEYLKKFSKKS